MDSRGTKHGLGYEFQAKEICYLHLCLWPLLLCHALLPSANDGHTVTPGEWMRQWLCFQQTTRDASWDLKITCEAVEKPCFWILYFFPKAFCLAETPISSTMALKRVYQRAQNLRQNSASPVPTRKGGDYEHLWMWTGVPLRKSPVIKAPPSYLSPAFLCL